MSNKPKGPSLSRVAKNYKKTTKPSGNVRDTVSGKRFTVDGAIPTRPEMRTPTKLKAMSMTYGGTRKGKGATIIKRGKA
jgi:hypothetical protein